MAALKWMGASRNSSSGNKPGPQRWSVGSKLWETQVFHKHTDTLQKYPLPFTVDSEGGNDSIYQVFKKQETLLSPDGFAKVIESRSCLTGSGFTWA